MLSFFRKWFCKHAYEYVRDIHGDEIRERGWKRSVWQCELCGRVEYWNYLYTPEEDK